MAVKRPLHGAPQTARDCNVAEFVGRGASPEEAAEGVGPWSRGTDPRFVLDAAAAYLSGIGRHRLPHQAFGIYHRSSELGYLACISILSSY